MLKKSLLCYAVIAAITPVNGAGVTIFGALPFVDPMIGAISMVIIVAVVLIVEHFFHRLHSYTHDTPFEQMLISIQKELMIVGTMSFIFKIILQSTSMNIDWVLGLEFADTVVPITSFVCCTIGVMLIVMSLSVVKHWIKSYHLHLYEVLENYYENAHSWFNKPNLSFLPISSLNSQMEFRIFHSIFCENYNIKRDAFAFDQYVYRIFEKYLLKILDIDSRNWFIILGLTMLNWLRYETGIDVHECVRKHSSIYGDGTNSNSYSDRRRYLAGGSRVNYEHAVYCDAPSSVDNFTIAGFFLFLFSLFLAIISRKYELKLMETRGIENSDDYCLYLQSYEEAHEHDNDDDKNNKDKDNNKLSENDLKEAIEIAKRIGDKKVAQDKSKHHSKFDPMEFISNFHDSRCYRFFSNIFCTSPVSPEDVIDFKFEDKLEQQQQQEAAVKKVTPDSSEITTGDRKIQPKNLFAGAKMAGKMLRKVKINRNHKAQIEEFIDTEAGTLKARENFNKIFLFSKPDLYFEVIDVYIMLIAYYLACWITNYASIAKTVGDHISASTSATYEVQTLLPGILSVLMYIYSVKCAALLLAVTQPDNNSMLEVIEQTEGTRMLGKIMRDRMLQKLKSMGDPETHMKTLFEEIDDNNSNLLSRQEFQIFLEALGITFSRQKWTQIFVEIDLNNDDEISFRELFLFLFPDNNMAKLEEIKRLKMIGMKAHEMASNIAINNNNAISDRQRKVSSRIAEQLAKKDLSIEEYDENENENEHEHSGGNPIETGIALMKPVKNV